MKYLAQCVVRYAQCLWQAQPLLPPTPTSNLAAPSSPEACDAAGLVDAYLAGLLTSLAALPRDQYAALALAARMGQRPALVGKHHACPVRDALLAGQLPVPPRVPVASIDPWQDDSLAAIVLRSLRYALDLTDALPDPHATSPMTAANANQQAALWSAAHVLEEQQAALWDAVETVSANEVDALAAEARNALAHVDPESQHAELLAYFASGMFAQRVQAQR